MEPHPPLDEARFRRAMAQFATGVTVVTTAMEGRLYGLTVNAFCSLSLDPPLTLVCVDQLSRSQHLIGESGCFAVNILSWQQQFLADRFAGRAPLVNTAFDGVPYVTGATGAPILKGAAAWADCRLLQSTAAGDHVIFVGNVVAADWDETQEPLLFYQSRFARLRSP